MIQENQWISTVASVSVMYKMGRSIADLVIVAVKSSTIIASGLTTALERIIMSTLGDLSMHTWSFYSPTYFFSSWGYQNL